MIGKINFSCQDKTPEFSREERKKIENKKIIVVGAGALGTIVTELLIRTGVKNLTIIDYDKIEAKNLPRQTLYNEEDIGNNKAETAAKKLKKINKEAKITAIKQKLTRENAEELLKEADLVMGCTDNIESRIIIDEWAEKNKKPWVHAAVERTTGEVMLITPESSKYRDYMSKKKKEQKCNETGIIVMASTIIGSFQTILGLKALIGQTEKAGILSRMNVWQCTKEDYIIKKR